MKVLFASSTDTDWIASTLYQGLVEVLGAENVFDATGGCRSLPNNPAQATRLMEDERGFDLLVINSCFRREHNWDWVCGHLGVETKGEPNARLLPTARIVFVEGHDSASFMEVPPFPCDAYFRREIDPAIKYPYPCRPMNFAMPKSAFVLDDHKRDIDVCCLVAAKEIDIRCRTLDILETLKGKYVIAASGDHVPMHGYVDFMCRSKLAICLPGGAYCGDCMRHAECLAYGAIPVFVCLPRRVWEPDSYPLGTCFFCNNLEDLRQIISGSLRWDSLNIMRNRMQEHALEHHTTRARAEKLLSF